MPRINTSGVSYEEEATECPGNSSETSTDSKSNDTEKSETKSPLPVRSTEPRSTEKDGTSTASSAGGSTRAKK